MYKLIWTNLTQTFESSNFRIRTKFFYCILAFLFCIAISSNEITLLFLLTSFSIFRCDNFLILNLCTVITYTEQRCLQLMILPLLCSTRKELHEDRQIASP